jgi:hypothetical protein
MEWKLATVAAGNASKRYGVVSFLLCGVMVTIRDRFARQVLAAGNKKARAAQSTISTAVTELIVERWRLLTGREASAKRHQGIPSPSRLNL